MVRTPLRHRMTVVHQRQGGLKDSLLRRLEANTHKRVQQARYADAVRRKRYVVPRITRKPAWHQPIRVHQVGRHNSPLSAKTCARTAGRSFCVQMQSYWTRSGMCFCVSRKWTMSPKPITKALERHNWPHRDRMTCRGCRRSARAGCFHPLVPRPFHPSQHKHSHAYNPGSAIAS